MICILLRCLITFRYPTAVAKYTFKIVLNMTITITSTE